jgi:hypothetical protein
LYQLLGDVPLAIKATQMSDELYARIFGHQELGTHSHSSDDSASP